MNNQIANLEVEIKDLENTEYPAEDEVMHMQKEIEAQKKSLESSQQQKQEEILKEEQSKAVVDEIDRKLKELKRKHQEYKDSVHDKRVHFFLFNFPN